MYVKSCKHPHVLMYIFSDGQEDTINTFVTAVTKQLTEATKQWFMLAHSLRGTLHCLRRLATAACSQEAGREMERGREEEGESEREKREREKAREGGRERSSACLVKFSLGL